MMVLPSNPSPMKPMKLTTQKSPPPSSDSYYRPQPARKPLAFLGRMWTKDSARK
jgi:hypothetical protein